MEQEIHRFVGSPDCRDGIAAATLSQSIDWRRDEKGLKFFDASGRIVAKATNRHNLARKLSRDNIAILHCSANCIHEPSETFPNGKIHLRVILGSPGEVYTPPEEGRNYLIGLSGESFCQPAIRKCRVGDIVLLRHESDNQYDPLALAVIRENGERIGYIPRNSWFRDAVHRDHQGASAQIISINQGGTYAGIVVRVSLGGEPITRRQEQPPGTTEKRRGWLARFFGI